MGTTCLVFSKKPFDDEGEFENELIYAPDPGQPCEITLPKSSLDALRAGDELIVVGDSTEWRVFVAHLSRRCPRLDGVAIYPRCFVVEHGRLDPAAVHQEVIECLELTFNTRVTARELDSLEIDYRN